MFEVYDFNYFYFEFVRETQRRILENPNYINDWEQTISIFDSVLWVICVDYISLDALDIFVLPSDTFELVKMILDSKKDANNRRAFLLSLQFILVRYLVILDYGNPILILSEAEEEKQILELRLDDNSNIDAFESINMSEEEMTKLMFNLCNLLKNKMYGPYEMVRIRNCDNIY